MIDFWHKLKVPFTVLAPMESVTEFVFREIVSTYAKPDVLFTEFTNVDGLLSVGRKKVEGRLDFSSTQRPIVAQIWGTNPAHFYEASKIVTDLGFDGIDINMGCPDRDVVKVKAGAALITTPTLVTEIIKATREGSPNLPLSVKTRLGFKEVQTDKWIGFLLSHNLEALTVHARIAKDMSKNPADWGEIGRIVKLRDSISRNTLIIGNGDISNMSEVVSVHHKFKVDGVMIGRGIFSNFFVFRPDLDPHSLISNFKILKHHARMFRDRYGETKDFNILKKFVKMYCGGFESISAIRKSLMQSENYEHLFKQLEILINGKD